MNTRGTNEISDKVVVETAKADEFEVESLSVIEAYSVKNLASHEEYLQTSEDLEDSKTKETSLFETTKIDKVCPCPSDQSLINYES